MPVCEQPYLACNRLYVLFLNVNIFHLSVVFDVSFFLCVGKLFEDYWSYIDIR